MAPDIQGSYLSIFIDTFTDLVFLGRVGTTIARVYD